MVKEMHVKFGVMLWSSWLCRIQDAMDTFLLAEKLNFDSLWMGDHLVSFHPNTEIIDPWMTMALLAANTKRVKIGPSVTDPHRRHPAVLAQMGATLDVLSKGRFILAIGAGEAMNLDPYGFEWSNPLSRLEEFVMVMRILWTQQVCNFQGKFFKLKSAYLQPKPIQKPHPPIWIAGYSKKTLDLIGRVADGYINYGSSPEFYSDCIKNIATSAKKVGRDVNKMETAVLMPTAVEKNYDEAKKYVEEWLRTSILFSPQILRRLGVKPPSDDFSFNRTVWSPETVKRIREESEKIPLEKVKYRAVFGTPEDCIDTIERYVKAGANHIIVRPHSSDPKIRARFLRTYASKILPYFRK
jgi:alkanesulfonate monooxygenase SsuD/methylene tetrahydromethanopterin reductase-like flavin-dependent oxidoreductase (luciferase family)